MKPDTPTALLRTRFAPASPGSHEETTCSEIIGSLAEVCQQRGGKNKNKVTLDGDEIWSIIQDLGVEHKCHETSQKTVCSTASFKKFDVTLFVVRTPQRCDPSCLARNMHYHCCCHSESGQ